MHKIYVHSFTLKSNIDCMHPPNSFVDILLIWFVSFRNHIGHIPRSGLGGSNGPFLKGGRQVVRPEQVAGPRGGGCQGDGSQVQSPQPRKLEIGEGGGGAIATSGFLSSSRQERGQLGSLIDIVSIELHDECLGYFVMWFDLGFFLSFQGRL